MSYRIYQRDAVGGFKGAYGKRGISWTAWRVVFTASSVEEHDTRLEQLKRRNGLSEFKTKEIKK